MKKFEVEIGQKVIRYRTYYVEAESIDDLLKLSASEIDDLAYEQGAQIDPEYEEYYDEYEFAHLDKKDSIKEVA